jgi:hypothetical protein
VAGAFKVKSQKKICDFRETDFVSACGIHLSNLLMETMQSIFCIFCYRIFKLKMYLASKGKIKNEIAPKLARVSKAGTDF